MSERMAEAPDGMATDGEPAGRVARLLAFLTNPATMIAMALLAISLFATPYYLRTTEQQLFNGELLLSLCGGFSRPIEPREQARRPLL